jgi:hypothetical protein
MRSTSAPAPIDPRGPRANQAVLATGLVLGLLFGQEWVAPLFAVVLFLGAAFGPGYGPVLRIYRDVVRSRLAPPKELEDPRPPRFAAAVGVAVLAAATIAFVLDAATVGWVLVVVVAALAGLSAVTGLCVGCEMYVALVRLRGGVRVVKIDRVADGATATRSRSHGDRRPDGARHGAFASLPDQFGDERPDWVVFSTEYCAVCPSVVAEIERCRPGERVIVLDVAEHLDLASRYRVRRAPTVLRADADGMVVARLSGVEAIRRELASTATV